MTDCTQLVLALHPDRPVHVVCDAPETSSDGGALLLHQMDERLGLTARLAACLPDRREPTRVEHPRAEQYRQRVLQIALGYEDGNDATTLRLDPMLNLACGRGLERRGLSSQPTLSRFEHAADMRALKRQLQVFEDVYLESFAAPPETIVLDIDSTDDPTHGHQQLSMFHGFYDQHMYHPLLVFDGVRGQLITAVLRPGRASAARGAVGVLRRLIRRLKARFPATSVVVRADAAFAAPRVLALLEQLQAEYGDIEYLIGLEQNAALLRLGQPWLAAAQARVAEGERLVRSFGAFPYAAKTWPRRRHVVVKAEHSRLGANPRFVVTSLVGFPPALLYDAYCARGQCENFIKEFKNALQADRLSCTTFVANFGRLLLHAAAYVLLHALRTALAPHAPTLAAVQMDTLRLRLLKVAAHVTQSSRRVLVRLPRAFPLAAVFCAIARALGPLVT